ncbi:hypothetical protein T07_10934 [Trichinella nelsoni]|uniref:Uncharacterized protein n=1 Tax=Trichinella nelsoni TaxID=6336 RepID=A0A0V0S4X6_9BILA|nr:hypothetical protein T07_10934 [Trichinella nelsoni]
MKERDDDVNVVYQQHSCYRRSSVAEANCSLKSFCEYENQEDSVGCTVISFIFCNMSVLQCFNDVSLDEIIVISQIATILHVSECMVMMVRSELQFSPTRCELAEDLFFHWNTGLASIKQCRLVWSNSYINNNSSIIIRHLDIRHGNTCAELEFLSPISSVIKRYQICKSASPTVS